LYSAGSGTNNIGKKMGLDAYANMYIAAESSTPGVTSRDFITVKFTTNGALAWAVRYNSPENAFDTPTGIAVVMPNAPPGSAVNAVIYVSGQSNSDVATVKYSQPTVICCAFNAVNVTAEELRGRFNVSNYPNPARTYTNIEYELAADAKVTIDVYDVFGRKVTTLVNGSKKAGTYIVKLNSAGLANGLYNYQFTIQSGEHTFRQSLAGRSLVCNATFSEVCIIVPMHLQEEKALLKQIQKDPQAFSILYDHYYTPIFAYVLRRLGQYELARDITAETFLKAFQKINSFQWREIPVSTWLYRIATNESLSFLRNSKYKPSSIEDLNLYLPYEEGIETEKAALAKAFRENKEFMAVQQHLLRMDIKYQEVISLRFFEEKSIKDIAAILGKNEGTVKSLLSRGLDKLRALVEDELNN